MKPEKKQTPSLGKQILNSITDALMEPRPQPAPLAELSGVPHPGTQTYLAIARMRKFSLTADLKAKVTDLDRHWQAATDGQNAHSYDAARKAFAEAQRQLGADTAAGKNISNTDAWTLADWAEDFQLKSRGYAAGRAAICKEAFALLRPMLEKFAQEADACALDFEAAEIETHRNFGVPYRRSTLVLAAYKAAATVRYYMQSFSPASGAKPGNILQLLPLLEI